MNLQKIEQLLEKYDRGESTLEEENQLKEFFLNGDYPEILKGRKDLFSYYELSKKEEIPSLDFDEKILSAITKEKVTPFGKRRQFFYITAIAASIVILFGIYFRYGISGSSLKDTYDDPRLAYAETKKILLRVSANINTGVNEMKNIKHFNTGLSELNKFSAFQTGLSSLERVSILDKTKEILTSKNK